MSNLIEVYGFVGYITSFVAYLCFLLWAFLPESVLQQVGVTYYPSKYWAIALPAYFVAIVFFVHVVYVSLNLLNTAPLDSYDTLTDDDAKQLTDRGHRTSLSQWTTPDIADIPVSVVNKLLLQGVGGSHRGVSRRTRPAAGGGSASGDGAASGGVDAVERDGLRRQAPASDDGGDAFGAALPRPVSLVRLRSAPAPTSERQQE